MSRKRKKSFLTPEEQAAWRARELEIQRQLDDRIELARADLHARGVTLVEDLEHWIDRARVEISTGTRPAR